MITKKLIQQITAFHNLYLGCNGVITSINIFNIRDGYISCDMCYWTINKGNTLGNCIKRIDRNIHNEEEFIAYKQEVLETFKEFKIKC